MKKNETLILKLNLPETFDNLSNPFDIAILGKNWILQHSTDSAKINVVLQYLLKKYASVYIYSNDLSTFINYICVSFFQRIFKTSQKQIENLQRKCMRMKQERVMINAERERVTYRERVADSLSSLLV